MSETRILTPSKSVEVHVIRLSRAAKAVLANRSSIGDFEVTAMRVLNLHGDNIREDERGAHWDASAEITSLRAQLDEARSKANIAILDAADLAWKLGEARRKAISECIEIAESELADPKSSGRSIAKRLRDLLGG